MKKTPKSKDPLAPPKWDDKKRKKTEQVLQQWALLNELVQRIKNHKSSEITRTDVSLYGDPFSRTDFSTFWSNTHKFLRATAIQEERRETDNI